MANRFEDRLSNERYEDDPPVGVFDDDQSNPQEAWVPERLWMRLRHLGFAYELNYLPMLDGQTEPKFLNATQAASLEDELEFIVTIVNDSLLIDQIKEIQRVVVSGIRTGRSSAIRVEGH